MRPKSIDIILTKPPKNGVITVNDEDVLLQEAYLRSGSIFNCVGTKLPGKQLYYTSTMGFEGHDRFSVTVPSSKLRASDV